jgi:hypothetical protein
MMSDSIRILAFSDIYWLPRHQGTNLKELIGLVKQVEPTLLLLAGDLVDDFKGGGDGKRLPYWQELGKFLDFLEDSQVRCYFVKGNWDAVPEYAELIHRKHQYVEDISQRLAETNNIHVYGIPHAYTDQLATMKTLRHECPPSIDVILAHAEGRRRIWLFELPVRLIITGHFDEKLCMVRDKIFVSFSSFPGQYAVIDYYPHEIHVRYICYRQFDHTRSRSTRYEMQIKDGILVGTTGLPDDWLQYGQQMDALLTLKEREQGLNESEKREAINALLEQGVYKAHILEYIPGARAILKKS